MTGFEEAKRKMMHEVNGTLLFFNVPKSVREKALKHIQRNLGDLQKTHILVSREHWENRPKLYLYRTDSVEVLANACNDFIKWFEKAEERLFRKILIKNIER